MYKVPSCAAERTYESSKEVDTAVTLPVWQSCTCPSQKGALNVSAALQHNQGEYSASGSVGSQIAVPHSHMQPVLYLAGEHISGADRLLSWTACEGGLCSADW